MPDIHARKINLFIYFYMFYFLTNLTRTELNSEQKMHNNKMAHYGASLELVSKVLLSAFLLENNMLYSTGRGKRLIRLNFVKYVNLVGDS